VSKCFLVSAPVVLQNITKWVVIENKANLEEKTVKTKVVLKVNHL